jgi:hypothetical protein
MGLGSLGSKLPREMLQTKDLFRFFRKHAYQFVWHAEARTPKHVGRANIAPRYYKYHFSVVK